MNIKKVTPYKDLFSITWNIGPRCNFACSYCPPMWHNKTSPHKTLEEFQSIWLDILEKTKYKNKNYKLSFSGGEVTLNKSFKPFIIWLYENYKDRIENIGITTNGSATLKYYLELIDYVDFISFSSHFDWANKNKFYKNITETHKKATLLNKNIYVNIMNEANNQKDINELFEYCEKNKIPAGINAIREIVL